MPPPPLVPFVPPALGISLGSNRSIGRAVNSNQQHQCHLCNQPPPSFLLRKMLNGWTLKKFMKVVDMSINTIFSFRWCIENSKSSSKSSYNLSTNFWQDFSWNHFSCYHKIRCRNRYVIFSWISLFWVVDNNNRLHHLITTSIHCLLLLYIYRTSVFNGFPVIE